MACAPSRGLYEVMLFLIIAPDYPAKSVLSINQAKTFQRVRIPSQGEAHAIRRRLRK